MTHDAKETRQLVRGRRDAILDAAANAMHRARARRIRRARFLSAASVAALLSGVVATISRAPGTPRNASPFAIDFAIERTAPRRIDFATIAARRPDGDTDTDTGDGAGGTRALAIDFASVVPTGAPSTRRVELLTDREAEQALAESGLCARILRVSDRPLLVDCRTGARLAIR